MTTPRSSRRELLAATGGLGLLGLAGCIDDLGGTTSPAPDPLTPKSTASGTDTPTTPTDADRELLLEGTTELALDLHQRIATTAPESNALAAPYSISTALAMTFAGARGTTAEELAEVCGFPPQRVHATVAALDEQVDHEAETPTASPSGENDVPFQIDTVNALWGQQGYPFSDQFLRTLATHYGAGLRPVDFEARPEQERTRINDWVAGQTNDRITDLLPEGAIDGLTRLVLTNAVYFRANWARQFSEEATERRTFTALGGTTSEVPTMHQSAKFPYAEVDGHQVVELPYEHDDYGMVVVLPPEGQFRETEGSVDPDRLREWFDALSVRDGSLFLPKFTVRSSVKLNDHLSTLGMPTAFDPNRANFSGMVEGDAADLYLSGVFHQTFIEVAEWGTEAAGATGAVGSATSAPANPFEMRVDRPFLFCIRHRPTDSVLFLGRVVDAAAAQG